MSLSIVEQSRLDELEAIIERGLESFIETGSALLEVRDSRLYRQSHGTFENYCQQRWGFTRQRAYQLVNEAAVGALVSNVFDTQPSNAAARGLAPLRHDETEVLAAWNEAQDQATAEGVKLSAQIVRNAAQKRIDRIKREKAAAEPVQTAVSTLPPNIRIEHGDFRNLDIPDASVDLIFTDPPYPAEFLDLWYDLGEFAARVLKPGRMLVAYSGQFHIPEVIQALCSNLSYFWLGTIVTPGAHNNVMVRRVRSVAKPLLFFQNGPGDTPWVSDAYISERREKALHPWQQSEGCATYYIEQFTTAGALVCDPFLGSGTTAVEAAALGRSFIGCDVDGNYVRTALERLA